MPGAPGGYRTPPMLPSVLVVAGATRWYQAARMRGWKAVGLQAALAVLLLFNAGGWLFGKLLLLTVALLLLVGPRRIWRVRRGREPGLGYFDSAYKLFCLTMFGIIFSCLMYALDNGWASFLGVLIGMLIVEFLATPGVGGDPVKPWWSHERMARTLVSARVLTSPGKDAEGEMLLPTLHYRGRPVKTEAGGIEVTYDLPEGATWSQVVSKHAALASAMRLPVERLHLEHDEDHPACAISITVLPPQSKGSRPAQLPERTVWADGLELGPDRLGRSVPVRTVGAHSVFVGQTGSGKTCLGRWGLAHALLDPTVRIFCIDGKDDLTDWRPMEPLCEMFVGGATRESIKAVKALLLNVEKLADERGRTGDKGSPIVVIIDEWHRIREAAKRHDKQLGLEIDSLLSELAATVRSRNISLWVFTQRGTAEYIPTDLRANLIQRFVGMTYEEAEVRYILDKLPEVLPSRTAQFLVGSDRMNATLATVPDFDDAAFMHVVSVATRLRRELPLPPLHLIAAEPTEYVTSTQVVTHTAAQNLEQAVRQILADGALLPHELHAALPARLQPPSVIAMGRQLGRLEREGKLCRPSIGRDKGWALLEVTHRGIPRAPAVDLPETGTSGGSDTANYAQNDPRIHTSTHHPEHAMALP